MSVHKKRVALRTCVICRQKFDKRDVVRFVYTTDGLQMDPSGKINGRGAYICKSTPCRERLSKTDVLAKALRHPLNDTDREVIRQAVS